MIKDFTVKSEVYRMLLTVDASKTIFKFTAMELRPILPCLVRTSLIAPSETTPECTENRRHMLLALANNEAVNSIIALLSINFHQLEMDVKQEQSLRKKLGGLISDSYLIPNSTKSIPLSLDFERSDSSRKLRLVIYELYQVATQLQDTSTYVKSSDLFDNFVYMPEICDTLSIALSELPVALPVMDIVQLLLHVKHGPNIICWIVANSVDVFHDVCAGLINYDKCEEENGGVSIRMQTLTLLCRMNPSAAYVVRSKCIELCKMAPLVVTLTLEFTPPERRRDVVAFVSSLLIGSDQNVQNWFGTFFRNKGKNSGLEGAAAIYALREELLLQMRNVIQETQNALSDPSVFVHGAVLLRLYCVLRNCASIKFEGEEIYLLSNLMSTVPPPTPEGVRFASVGICMFFACSQLIETTELDNKCVAWLKALSGSDSPFFGKATDVTSSISEMLLLSAIHVHSAHWSGISELVCNTLGIQFKVKTHNTSRAKNIFTHQVFTEQVVTARAINMLVTPNLNANIHGYLPIHCIYQLLKSRAFSKYKVNVKNWVYEQICASVAPLHPLLPSLVEVYVNSMLQCGGRALDPLINQPITEEELMVVFRNSLSISEKPDCKKYSITAQLLLLYYVLLYEDVRLQNVSSAKKQNRTYSAEFLSDIPIKYLIQQARSDQENFANLFPPLLRLLANHFRHLALVEDWIDDDEQEKGNNCSEMFGTVSRNCSEGSETVSKKYVNVGLDAMTKRPARTSRVLRRLLKMSSTQIWPYATLLMEYLPIAMRDNVPRYIQELYKRVWMKLNTVLPRTLWALTINALQNKDSVVQIPSSNFDALQILRSDTSVYRCAPILCILIRVLQSSLASSRIQLNRHLNDVHLNNATTGNNLVEQEREDLKNALIATQESLAVQILLESCVENENDKSSMAKMWSLREIQSLICSYLHQMFIADTGLAKLVHFQGYPLSLLPVTVTGIPSMHICIDFVPELISQPSLEKQSFAVNLISYLGIRYTMPNAMMVSRLAVVVLTELLNVLPGSSRNALFMPSLPALARICQAFPPLIEDCLLLLNQLGNVAVSEQSFHLCPISQDTLNMTDDDSEDNDSEFLYEQVEKSFVQIASQIVANRRIY